MHENVENLVKMLYTHARNIHEELTFMYSSHIDSAQRQYGVGQLDSRSSPLSPFM